ncbi:hypothetical protein HYY75_10630 [bacterium]|nr:hypothetical protein [bacterium]
MISRNLKVVFFLTLFISSFNELAFCGNRINGWFIFGTNLAWFDGDYGHDLGVAHKGWNPSFTEEKCRKYFSDIARMGCRVVRVWAFEAQEGLLFDKNDKMVTGLSPKFLENCDSLMAIALENKLSIYWSLLNHLIAEDENGKHLNILSDKSVRQSYIKNALIPFVKRYSTSPAFFAIDLMNEVDGAVGKFSILTGSHKWRGVSWDTMRTFLKDCTSAIHGGVPGVKVTATSGWNDYENVKRGKFLGLGLDFFDWHSYNDAGRIPHVKDLNIGNTPCLLGEYGPAKKERDDALQGKNWDNYLNAAYSKGYAGVLSWSYGTPGEDSNFSLTNKDGSWRPGAKVMAKFSYNHPDCGPIIYDENSKIILSTVNQAVKSIMNSDPALRSYFSQLIEKLRPFYPYRNPQYALRKLVEMCRSIHETRSNLLGKVPQIERELEAVRKLANDCFQMIKSAPKSEELFLNRETVKRLEEIPFGFTSQSKDLSQPQKLKPVEINSENQLSNSKNPFSD